VPDLERDLIETVCHQVLDIYSKPKSKTTATPGKTPVKRAARQSGKKILKKFEILKNKNIRNKFAK